MVSKNMPLELIMAVTLHGSNEGCVSKECLPLPAGEAYVKMCLVFKMATHK
jgi:hypothetical protein